MMKRKVRPLKRNQQIIIDLPDAINCSPSDNFTQIPNKILRNPELTAKAKGILCLLLSNQDGWKSHITTICNMMADGKTAIDSGLKELEKYGYLRRLAYRDKNTKIRRGTIWCYANDPEKFEPDKIFELLDYHGLELVYPITLKAITGKPRSGFSSYGKPAPNNTKDKNTKDNNISFSHPSGKKKILSDSENETNNFGSSIEENPGSSLKEINIPFLPLASKLAGIIQTNKNIKITPSKLAGWAADIGKLSRIEGVALERIESALDWYADNIGGQYIPVIESGGSLRNKFIKLEDAMKRAGISGTSQKNRQGGESPKRLIKEHFNGLAPAFEKDCYLPAKELIPGLKGRGERAKLTQNLIELYNKIEDAQERHIPKESQHLFPGAMSIINLYIDWIGDNSWIKDKSINLFSMDHLLFNKFRREEAHKDNLERDPVTGKSYMKG